MTKKGERKKMSNRVLYRQATVELGHRPSVSEFKRYKIRMFRKRAKVAVKRSNRARPLDRVWSDVGGVEDIGYLSLLSAVKRAKFIKRFNKIKIRLR